MAENVVGVTLEAKTAQFVGDIRSAGVQSEAALKALSAQYLRTLKAAESASKAEVKAAREAASANKELAGAASGASDSVNKAAKALGPLGGILSQVSPAAGTAAASIAGLTSAAEGFQAAGLVGSLSSLLPVLLPVGLAVGGLALAYQHYSSEAEAAEKAQEAVRVEAEKSIKVFQDLKTEVSKLDQDWEVATGQLSKVAAQAENAKQHVLDLYTEPLAAQQRTIDATRALVAERQKNFVALSREEGGSDAAAKKTQDLIHALERQEAVYGGLVKKRDQEIAKADEAIAAGVIETRVRKQAEEGAKAHAAALAALTASYEEHAASVLANQARVTGGTQALLDAAESSANARLTGEEKVDAALAETVKRYGEIAGAALLASNSETERQVIVEARERAITEAVATAEAEKLRIREAASAQASAAAQRSAAEAAAAEKQAFDLVATSATQGLALIGESLDETYSQSASMVLRLEDQLARGEEYFTEAQKEQLKKRIEAQKDAARKQFNAAKAAKVAEAIASTALAAINALAQSPPPSPFGAIGAGIATAAGLAAVAVIQSQQPAFHSGGPVDLAPDEQRAVLRDHEYVLNPTARSMIGDDQLAKANAGVSSGGGDVVAVSVYRHSRIVERWKKDGLLRGDPIAQAIAAGKLVGHRSR